MEKKIDLLDFLSRVVQENTRAYREDFDYDEQKITQAAQESNMENRVFYWMSRDMVRQGTRSVSAGQRSLSYLDAL